MKYPPPPIISGNFSKIFTMFIPEVQFTHLFPDRQNYFQKNPTHLFNFEI